ncbi:2-Hydroxyacid oxidase 2-like isoform X2 [Ptychodera flava]
MSTTVLGEKLDAPICISPTALHGLAHPDGEVATCKAAADMNTLMAVSSVSLKSIEDVAAARPYSPKWQNIYIWRLREVMKDMVRRAEVAGFKAIVVSVDIPEIGFKRSLRRTTGGLVFKTFHYGTFDKYVNKEKDVNWSLNDVPPMEVKELAQGYNGATWKDIAWLKTVTKLPIVLKGILTVEDALLAAEHGVQGILVSNHGGRQLDCVPATIDVLSDIVDAVGNKLEVYVDGGVRTGTDVLKALALGARAVFVGRPVIFGLACNGEEGVKSVLKILRDELSLAMALSGCSRLSDVTRDLVIRHDVRSKL